MPLGGILRRPTLGPDISIPQTQKRRRREVGSSLLVSLEVRGQSNTRDYMRPVAGKEHLNSEDRLVVPHQGDSPNKELACMDLVDGFCLCMG